MEQSNLKYQACEASQQLGVAPHSSRLMEPRDRRASTPPLIRCHMRRLSQLTPLAVAVLLLSAWEIAVRIFAVPQFILPAPSVIAVRFAEAWADGTMLRHLVPTVTEVTIGGLLGGGLGLVIGVTLGLSGSARRVVSPYLVAAQSTPILALGPVLVLWLGPGLAAKVAVCALITLFPVAISTLVAVRDVDAGTLELMRSLGATRWQSLRYARLPAARSGILAGARVAATLAVVGAIVGEWLGGTAGLGVLLNLARGSLFDTPLLFADLLQIAIVGVSAYALVLLFERVSSKKIA
jgi:NitT/TauT family transport system permease protein